MVLWCHTPIGLHTQTKPKPRYFSQYRNSGQDAFWKNGTYGYPVTNPLRNPNLNQMICVSRSEVKTWIMIHELIPKFWSKSNDSGCVLQSESKKICKPAPKYWSKSNYLWSTLQSLDLNDSWNIISDRDLGAQSQIFKFTKWFTNSQQSSDMNQMIYKPTLVRLERFKIVIFVMQCFEKLENYDKKRFFDKLFFSMTKMRQRGDDNKANKR